MGTGAAVLSPRTPAILPCVDRGSDGLGALFCGIGYLLRERWGRTGLTTPHVSPALQSAAAAPSPVMGSIAPSDAMAAGPMAPGFFQVQPGLGPLSP